MWVTVSLGIFSLVLSFVWSAIFKLNVREYLPFLLSGLIPWMMIASSVGESCTSLLGAEAIMKSRQFPYSILVHVVVARNAVIFAHNMLTYAIAALLCGVAINGYTILVLPGLLLLVLNLSWVCLLTAILCLRFRDFQQLVTIVLQVAMFVTPVFWPVEQLTGRRAIIVDTNVLYHLIEVVRAPLLGKLPPFESYAICLGLALIGWSLTYWVFSRKRHRLVYWF